MYSLCVRVLFLIQIAYSFEVYWNVPSIVCNTNYDMFINVSQFGIIQNEGDIFYGDQVVLMYDTGKFPYYVNNTGVPIAMNGGIPQLGNFTIHIEALKAVIEYRMPDVNFSGLGVLDMEFWRPIYRQNFASSSSLRIYQDKSKELERELHPDWTQKEIENEAERRFELYARFFMEKTLEVAREMRPLASWGYYIFPMCFNGVTNETLNCPPIVKSENDKLKWLYDASDALFPSAYLGIMNPEMHYQFVYTKVEEAMRVANEMDNPIINLRGKPRAPDVFSYTWYRYYEEETYLYVDDILNSFGIPRSLGARGVVVWGSTGDLSTKAKCERFQNYVMMTLGPAVRHINTIHSLVLQDLLDGNCIMAIKDGEVMNNCETIIYEPNDSNRLSSSLLLSFLIFVIKYLT